MPHLRVLLTGGAGFIGSHANKLLHDMGYQTIVVDDLSKGHRELARWGLLRVGSISDPDFLREVFLHDRIDAVLHFAGLTSVAESVADPAAYRRANVEASRVLLESMREADVKTMVFSSSAAVYGNPSEIPIREDAPLRPINPYGANKAEVESLMQEAEVEWGLRHVALRYFNAAGADQSSVIGEWHEPETHLIPLVLDAAMGRRDTISVFGDDYETPDGTCVRDYIHVMDLADAHVRAVKYALGGKSGAFNLGTGGGTSVKEVIAAAERITGVNIPTRYQDRREGDPPYLVADSKLARSQLGWRPRHRDLDHLIQDAWRWHKSLHDTPDKPVV